MGKDIRPSKLNLSNQWQWQHYYPIPKKINNTLYIYFIFLHPFEK